MPAPTIFAPARRLATRRRMLRTQRGPEHAPRYLIDDMVGDVLERLAFLRHEPRRSLIVGDWSRALRERLGGDVAEAEPADGFDEEAPYPLADGFDFIASLGTLDTVNDLPGALVHLRQALAPGGLAIVSFLGAGSLPKVRAALLAGDGERSAPRMHPMVDVRAGAQLLQRAGFADPVADSHPLRVRFADLDQALADLRRQGPGNVLARPGPPLTRAGLAKARQTFGEQTLETFEILTLTGWNR
ncbi:MAG: class I SAM-dependent methyltransferase [Novosphingobium sp.]|nr:class I SAM-dependent methyltransferase [Novosphingobium sp.]